MAQGLSAARIEHYWERGYTLVEGVLRPEEVHRYLERARQIAHGDHPPQAADRLVRDIHFAKGLRPAPEDPEHALWKLMNPDRFDPVMAECLRLPRVLDAVSDLIGADLLAFLLMFIYKPPGVPDSVHPFHQDAVFFPFGPHDRIVGVWIALDPAHADNGSLCVVPGSQRLDVVPHEAVAGVNAGAFGAPGAGAGGEAPVTLEVAPGDCVLFHPHLFHRTGGNRTRGHRRVLTLHVASATCRAHVPITNEFGFHSVRGRTHPGCLQPVDRPSVPLVRYDPEGRGRSEA
jgi:phytanoyl-CoA hydroxylase